MIEVSIEAGAGATGVSLTVRARSIQRALSLATELYPGSDVRVKYPIDPERFFVEDRGSVAGIVGFEQPKKIAA
jgi:hypothetical protein